MKEAVREKKMCYSICHSGTGTKQ